MVHLLRNMKHICNIYIISSSISINQQLERPNGLFLILDQRNFSLLLPNISYQDEGSYRCRMLIDENTKKKVLYRQFHVRNVPVLWWCPAWHEFRMKIHFVFLKVREYWYTRNFDAGCHFARHACVKSTKRSLNLSVYQLNFMWELGGDGGEGSEEENNGTGMGTSLGF